MSTMDCEFVQVAGRGVCSRCGSTVPLKAIGARQNCLLPSNVAPAIAAPPAKCGPGCQLSRLLRSVGIEYTADCGCRSHAKKMNQHGPEWCREHIDETLAVMRTEAEKRGLPFIPFIAAGMVRLAIRRAERESTLTTAGVVVN